MIQPPPPINCAHLYGPNRTSTLDIYAGNIIFSLCYQCAIRMIADLPDSLLEEAKLQQEKWQQQRKAEAERPSINVDSIEDILVVVSEEQSNIVKVYSSD